MSADQPESPLDVLSRVATMVEKSQASPPPEPMDQSSNEAHIADSQKPSNPQATKGCERSPSFKERHPKFRKSSTPDYLMAADQARIVRLHRQGSINESSAPNTVIRHRTPTPPAVDARHFLQPQAHASHDDSNEEINVDVVEEEEEEEGPLDMSIKKREDEMPPPPPLYRLAPLGPPPEPLPLVPPPAYAPFFRPPPPPYPLTASPPNPISSTTPAKCENVAPPPSYESSTASYPSSPSRKTTFTGAYADVSTTTPNSKEKRRSKKQPTKNVGGCGNDDDRPIREITIITDSSADPLLDEHFRRSLGEKNYQSLFKQSDETTEMQASSPNSMSPNSSSASSSTRVSPKTGAAKNEAVDPVKAFHDDMEMAGYTVEDHFAKALGDTWIKLQAKAKQEAQTKMKADKKFSEDSSASRVSSSTESSSALVTHKSRRTAAVP